MILETETDFATLANLAAERNAPALDLPTRAEVEGPQEAARFTVDTEEKACWVLRRLAAVETEAARVKAQAAVRLAELEADSRALHARFDSELEAFARQEAERRRRRTITLLDGSLCLRAVPARFTIADNEAAFVHARTAFPDAIKTTVTLDTAAYLKAAQETGELLPGMDAIPAKESFRGQVRGGEGRGGIGRSARHIDHTATITARMQECAGPFWLWSWVQPKRKRFLFSFPPIPYASLTHPLR